MFSSCPLLSPQLPPPHAGAYVYKTLLSESYKAAHQLQCCLSFDWYDPGDRWSFNSLRSALIEGRNAKEETNCLHKGFDCYMSDLQVLDVAGRFCHLFALDKNGTSGKDCQHTTDHYGHSTII